MTPPADEPAHPAAVARPESASGATAAAGAGRAAGHGPVVWLFTATIFLNAGLLFLVQPMFSRMVLPYVGGTSAVWNTCMLFFQAALLAGYYYAHVAPRLLGVRRHAAVHVVLLAAAVLTLPVAVDPAWAPPAAANPVPALLALLAVSLGLPFFLLSAGSPLLQRWFSRTGHPAAGNPYFLYAASNLGSMIALLAYPLLLEPRLRLAGQGTAWTYGYVLLLLLLGACAAYLWRAAPRPAPGAAPVEAAGRPAPPLPWRTRLHWAALAFVPSSLLLGVTTFLTTDIAAVPLLWILPLALYLLTFVVAFSDRPLLPHWLVLRAQPLLVVPIFIAMALGAAAWPTALLPLHVAAFFVVALACHGELYRRRPHVEHLTGFYLWISVGGVLGGAFNVLVAPAAFSTVLEYPLAFVLAAALRPAPGTGSTRRERTLDALLPAAVAAAMVAVLLAAGEAHSLVVRLAIASTAGLAVFRFADRPLRFSLGLAGLLAAAMLAPGTEHVLRVRSFFGVHTVTHNDGYHVLRHGSTVHGAQSLDSAERLEPLTYYLREGPVGQLFAGLPVGRGAARRVGVVGLGTGSVACYGNPGEQWTFFEIDPAVERIARDPRLFTFLRDCPADPQVVLGDARITLRQVRPGSFDLLVLDAFSSDAIPLHLLTREALDEYLRALAPGGAIAYHISNRHLTLEPVLARLAQHAGLASRMQTHAPAAGGDDDYRSSSQWVVVARSEQDLGEIAADARWLPLKERDNVGLWTDDYANILGIMKWR